MVGELLEPWPLAQRLYFPLDALEFTEGNSAGSLKGRWQHTVAVHSGASVLPHHLDEFQKLRPERLYVRGRCRSYF